MSIDLQSDMLAAVDLGSNSFHLVVARLQGGELSFVDRRKEAVRLAGGLDAKRRLSIEAQERGIDCLRRFGERLAPISSDRVRAVGTNTLRNAKNAPDFIARAEEALGHPIDIISGIEEARLVYLGVAGSLEPDQRSRLVVDIGGGSTEFIIGVESEPRLMESV